jgi:hypothetical protein
MVAAADTYIDATLALVGWANAAPAGERYPQMTVAEMRAARPDVLLLSTEPYPFRARDAARLAAEWGGGAPEMLKIDGQLGSWYGALTEEALRQLAHWLRGEEQGVVKPLGAGEGAVSRLS